MSQASRPLIDDASFYEIATMRTLVGVDEDELYAPALDLLARLNFAGNRLTFAHIEGMPGVQLNPAPLIYEYRDQADLEAVLRTKGELLLDQAVRKAIHLDLPYEPEPVYAVGNSSEVLMRIADEHRTDLVAIGSYRRGPLESFFLGSVGRALAIAAKQSFLIARDFSPKSEKLNVVFATDHSEYANRCFRRLLDMNPTGLGRISIVTATDPRFESRVARGMGIEGETPYVLSEAEARIRECGEHKAIQCRQRGIEAEFRLIEGEPATLLRQTMEETQSDLLVLGAQGHGILERLFIGSLALHQVVAESYSVLVLRVS